MGLFVGLCGLDLVYYLDGEMPKENTKARTADFDIRIGGPAANAAITYARLGGKARLISCVGHSEYGQTVRSILAKSKVELIDIADKSFVTPNLSCITVNTKNGNRTIVSGQRKQDLCEFDLQKLLENISASFCHYDLNMPVITSTLLRLLKEKSIPLVLDAGSYKDGTAVCLEYASEVIASSTFCDSLGRDVLALADVYGTDFSARTDGERPVLFKSKNKTGSIAPPTVKVVDTLGAGDVLHGAYCFFRYEKELSYEESMQKAVEEASYSVSKRGIY